MSERELTSWYEELKVAMEDDGEDFRDMICTLSEEELKRKFYDGYGREEGASFTAWGKKWVYFPISYDGSESVGRAPRNPCDISMHHQGG